MTMEYSSTKKIIENNLTFKNEGEGSSQNNNGYITFQITRPVNSSNMSRTKNAELK